MFLLGLCGPSACGKTSIAERLAEELGATLINLDNYFFLKSKVRKYDHIGKDAELPENTDWEAIHELVSSLREGKPTRVRTIQWKKRVFTERVVTPKEIIIFEGFLLLYDEELLKLLDLTVYIDTEDEVCITRRLRRDGHTRHEQWYREVTFPEYAPRRKVFAQRADVVLDGHKPVEETVRILLEKIRAIR